MGWGGLNGVLFDWHCFDLGSVKGVSAEVCFKSKEGCAGGWSELAVPFPISWSFIFIFFLKIFHIFADKGRAGGTIYEEECH